MVGLNSLVCSQVLVQVRLLGECLLAVHEGASVRLFVGVDSQVVVKIVPFAKGFRTPMVPTKHYSGHLRFAYLIIQVLKNCKL